MIGEEKGSVAISGRSSHKMTGLFDENTFMLHKSTTELELILCSLSKGFLVTFLGSWDNRSGSCRGEQILRKFIIDC